MVLVAVAVCQALASQDPKNQSPRGGFPPPAAPAATSPANGSPSKATPPAAPAPSNQPTAAPTAPPAAPKPSPERFPINDLIVQAFGAFIGAGLAFGFALWLARYQRQSDRTAEMVDEFSSREMVQSRFVTVNVETQIQEGKITLREVALSMVRDCPVGFTGETIDGLTEHQHITQVVGWMRRLAVHLQQRWVDRRVIAATLGGTLQWTLPVLLQLAEEAEAIMKEYPSARPPELRASWIYAVRSLDAELKKTRLRHRVPGRHAVPGRRATSLPKTLEAMDAVPVAEKSADASPVIAGGATVTPAPPKLKTDQPGSPTVPTSS